MTLVSVASDPKKNYSKKCFEDPSWKIILLLSLTVAFGITSFSVQSNNHHALAQGISSPKIQALVTTSTITSGYKVTQLATNHNSSIVDPANTTTVVQFGGNQNQNRTLNNATVNGNDPVAQFGSNQNQNRTLNNATGNHRTLNNATVNGNDHVAQFGSNQNQNHRTLNNATGS